MQALRVAAALQHATGELINDEHLAVAHDVLLVLAKERLGLERLDEVVHQLAMHVEVQVVNAQGALHLLHARLERGDGLALLVHLVVGVALEGGHDAGEAVVGVCRSLGNTRDDERRAGLVNQDGVDLIHDAERVATLHTVVEAHGHVVAQVVEPELRVGAVGDVRGVRGAAILLGHHRADHTHRQAQGLVHGPHPVGVA